MLPSFPTQSQAQLGCEYAYTGRGTWLFVIYRRLKVIRLRGSALPSRHRRDRAVPPCKEELETFLSIGTEGESDRGPANDDPLAGHGSGA